MVTSYFSSINEKEAQRLLKDTCCSTEISTDLRTLFLTMLPHRGFK